MYRRTSILPLLTSGGIGLAGGLLGMAWYLSTRVSPQPRRTYQDAYTFTPWELGVPYETVSVRSGDGLRLGAWWMPHPEARGVVIGCHGHGGNKADLLGIGTRSWQAGYSVLLFDFRGRGESDPWPQTLISREVDDLRAMVAFVRERAPGLRLGVIGFSMGAAVTLLTAAQEPAIAAVVADSSFTSGVEVVSHGVRQVLRIPPQALVHVTDALVSRRHGYRFSEARPIDAVARIAPRPLLIIHGDGDSLVPVEHARDLYAAAGQPKDLWVVADTEHCGAYFADRQGYCARVIGFWDQYLASI